MPNENPNPKPYALYQIKTRKSCLIKTCEKQRKMEEHIHTKMKESLWVTWKKAYEEEEEW